jgi:hypothetical protein
MTRMVKKVQPFKKPKGSLQYLQESALESYSKLVDTAHIGTSSFAMMHFNFILYFVRVYFKFYGGTICC